MSARVNSRIEWAVTWVVDGDTMGQRYTEFEDAAEQVRYLESEQVECWLDRIEYFRQSVPERGIRIGSEWMAYAGQEPGQLWERLADATLPLDVDVLTDAQWQRMCAIRNELGTHSGRIDVRGATLPDLIQQTMRAIAQEIWERGN